MFCHAGQSSASHVNRKTRNKYVSVCSYKTVRNHWPTTGRRGKMWTAMEGNRNGTAPTPEVKLLTALEPHLEKLSDDEIAAKIAVTEKILADRAGA